MLGKNGIKYGRVCTKRKPELTPVKKDSTETSDHTLNRSGRRTGATRVHRYIA